MMYEQSVPVGDERSELSSYGFPGRGAKEALGGRIHVYDTILHIKYYHAIGLALYNVSRATGTMSNKRKRNRPNAMAMPLSRKANGVRSRLGTGLRPRTYTPLPTQGIDTAKSNARFCLRYRFGERVSIEISKVVPTSSSRYEYVRWT